MREENDRLRARIQDLEEVLFSAALPPIEYGLTRQEARVFGVLVSRPLATKSAIMAALYDERGADWAEPKIVDVLVCKIRKKLAPFGIEILTRWGEGYFIADDMRQQLRRTV